MVGLIDHPAFSPFMSCLSLPRFPRLWRSMPTPNKIVMTMCKDVYGTIPTIILYSSST